MKLQLNSSESHRISATSYKKKPFRRFLFSFLKRKGEKMKNIEIQKLRKEESCYDLLITPLALESSIGFLQEYFKKKKENFCGVVVVDCIFTTGNTKNRFIEIQIINDEIQMDTLKEITLERKDSLRRKANEVLRKYPDEVRYSILNQRLKEMLLRGIDI